jgi:hypothetical protein
MSKVQAIQRSDRLMNFFHLENIEGVIGLPQWYHHPMTTATAQAFANIAFIKFTLAKLGRTNRTICFDGKLISG